MKLEELQPEAVVKGLVVGERATVIAVSWYGDHTVRVTFRTAQGVDECLLSRDDEPRLDITTDERKWPMNAAGHSFKLASEAKRIEMERPSPSPKCMTRTQNATWDFNTVAT